MGPRAALFVLLFGVYASFYASLGHNEAAHLDLVRALAEEGSLSVDSYRYNSADLVVKDGRTFSNKAPGAALLALPAFVAARAAVRPLSLAPAAAWDLVAYLTTLGSIGLLSCLAAVATFGSLSRAWGEGAALAAVLAVWLATPLFPFSTMLFGHAASAALIALAAARLFDRAAPGSASRDAAAGLALGLAVATEYPAAVVALPLLLYGLCARSRGAAVALALGFGAGLLPLSLYQRLAFGSVFFPSYQAYVEEGRRAPFPGHARGLLGVAWPGLAGLLDTLAEITIRPARGLLRLSPVLILAIPGLVLVARVGRRREAATIALASAALLILNACYGDSIAYWGGGTSLGPRLLIPALPLLAMPLAAAALRLPGVFLLLAGISGFVMLMGTAVEARVPYEISEPVRDFLLPRYLRGEFALHRAVVFTPGVPGEARNLGGILGLPGPWQLLPTALFGLLLGGALLRAARVPSAARRVLAAGVLAAALAPAVAAAREDEGHVVGAYAPDEPGGRPRLRREQGLSFDWRRDAPLLLPFRAAWRGTLAIEHAGVYGLRLEGAGEHLLALDGRELSAAPSPRGTRVSLSEGSHALALSSRLAPGASGLRLLWTPPGGVEAPVPPSAFRPWP